MARYKGRSSSKAIELDYPHIVEMAVPPSLGLGNRLNAMHDWHLARGVDSHNGQGRREEIDGEMCWYVRWCFADAAIADAFMAEFGGKLVKPLASKKA